MMAILAQSTTGLKPLSSEVAAARFSSWKSYAMQHQQLLDERIEAVDQRRMWVSKAVSLGEAGDAILENARKVQSDPADQAVVEKLLIQTHHLLKALQESKALAEKSISMDKRLISAEHTAKEGFPRILFCEDDEMSVIGGDSISQRHAGTANDTIEPIGSSEASSLTVKNSLDVIQSIEESILRLRGARSSAMDEAIEATEPAQRASILKNIPLYDTQEKKLVADLKAAMLQLDHIRGPVYEYSFQRPTAPPDSPSSSKLRGKQSTRPPNHPKAKEKDLIHKLRPMLLNARNPSPFATDMINSWLFNNLRSSEAELDTYVETLLKTVTLPRSMAPTQIANAALRHWLTDTEDLQRPLSKDEARASIKAVGPTTGSGAMTAALWQGLELSETAATSDELSDAD
jgi:hypothetical protein